MVFKILSGIMSSGILHIAVELLVPFMLLVFTVGVVARTLIFYTVKRQDWFAKEFEKRASHFIDHEEPGTSPHRSFYVLTKSLLERTFYEVFEVRDRVARRKKDRMMTLTDRIFMIRSGCAWIVKDILKQTKFLKWHDGNPKLLAITKTTFQQNPYFNRVFAIFPISGLNDVVSILPGLFVIGGIFGTFLGIVNGLPKLGGMSLDDAQMSKQVMDGFLFEVSFAMNSSIMGILLSVLMTIVNTVLSPDKAFMGMVERFEGTLDLLWYRSDNNEYPKNAKSFDEHKDPAAALAEEAVSSEVSKTQRTRQLDVSTKTKAS